MPGSQDYFGGITNTHDRRRYLRKITALNYVKLGESNGGILLNISEDGLAFTSAEVLVGEAIPRLRFKLEEKGDWIEASGRIVWRNDSKKGAGIQFVDISDSEREEIRRWIGSKTPSEIQDAVSGARRIRKESEVTTLPAPRKESRKIETTYEILEPHLQKMFPSESVLGVETAQPILAPAPQMDSFSETSAAPCSENFPSENRASREPALTSVPQTEMQTAVPEAQHGDSSSESTSRVRAAEPRFAQALQVETLPETPQARKEQTPEDVRQLEKPKASLDPPLAPVAKTNEFQQSNLAGRAVRVPNFGYQTSGYPEEEDWTNWVDPATTTHRGKLGFVVLGVLLVVAAFAVGVAFRHGSFEEFADSVRQRLPDKYRQAPRARNPGADSAATSTSGAENTKTDTPAQAQSDNTATQASEGPVASNPATPPGDPVMSSSNNEETQPAAASSEAGAAVAGGKTKPAVTGGDNAPILVAAAGGGREPFRLTTPEAAVSASSSVAISAQTTVVVPREAGAEAAQEPKRLQPGALVFRVDPQYPKKLGRNEAEIVKLVATVGEDGQVLNIQRVSGHLPFASVAMSAVREWRYSPTLFDGRPVRTEEKITIVFRR